MTYPTPPYGQPNPYPNSGFVAPVRQPGAVPERPKQVLIGGVLMFTVGAVGVLSLLFTLINMVSTNFIILRYLSLASVTWLLPSFLHIAIGVLGLSVIRGKAGARVAFFVVAGISVLLDGLNLLGRISNQNAMGWSSTVLVLFMLVAVITLIGELGAILALTVGQANPWFRAVKAAGSRRPVPQYPYQGQPPQQQQFQQQMGQQQPGQQQPGQQRPPMNQPPQGQYPQPGAYPQQGSYAPENGQ